MRNSALALLEDPARSAGVFTIGELAGRYTDLLWEEGRHKYNVRSFLGEIDEIFAGIRFDTFDQRMLVTEHRHQALADGGVLPDDHLTHLGGDSVQQCV